MCQRTFLFFFSTRYLYFFAITRRNGVHVFLYFLRSLKMLIFSKTWRKKMHIFLTAFSRRAIIPFERFRNIRWYHDMGLKKYICIDLYMERQKVPFFLIPASEIFARLIYMFYWRFEYNMTRL